MKAVGQERTISVYTIEPDLTAFRVEQFTKGGQYA